MWKNGLTSMLETWREKRRMQATEEATQWLDRIERTLKPSESAAFRAWLKVSLHREVIVDQCRLWHGPEVMGLLGQLIAIETRHRPPPSVHARMALILCITFAAFSSVTIFIAGSRFIARHGTEDNPFRVEKVYSTSVGEHRYVELADKSRIRLNTATHLLVSFGLHERDVTLLRGEASFEVTSDPNRPFRVFAGPRTFEIQSQGARFNLRKRDADQVEIIVTDGEVVAGASRGGAVMPPALIRLRPTFGPRAFEIGEGGTLGAGWQLASVLSADEIDRRLAWHEGKLVFVDERLSDVLNEFNRYTSMRVVLGESELADARLTAELHTGDVAEFRRTLREALAIDSMPQENGWLLKRVAVH